MQRERVSIEFANIIDLDIIMLFIL